MPHDSPLTSPGGDNVLSVSVTGLIEKLIGLKTISGDRFYVFTQPGPKAELSAYTVGTIRAIRH